MKKPNPMQAPTRERDGKSLSPIVSLPPKALEQAIGGYGSGGGRWLPDGG